MPLISQINKRGTLWDIASDCYVIICLFVFHLISDDAGGLRVIIFIWYPGIITKTNVSNRTTLIY